MFETLYRYPRVLVRHLDRPAADHDLHAEIDLEGKARALAMCEVTGGPTPNKSWRADVQAKQFVRCL
jgi:hypothetical protein